MTWTSTSLSLQCFMPLSLDTHVMNWVRTKVIQNTPVIFLCITKNWQECLIDVPPAKHINQLPPKIKPRAIDRCACYLHKWNEKGKQKACNILRKTGELWMNKLAKSRRDTNQKLAKSWFNPPEKLWTIREKLVKDMRKIGNNWWTIVKLD